MEHIKELYANREFMFIKLFTKKQKDPLNAWKKQVSGTLRCSNKNKTVYIYLAINL